MNRRERKATQLARKHSNFFIFDLRESDGNDCWVTDVIVEARNFNAARDAIGAYIDETYPDHESDGFYGTFAPCDCHCDHQSIGFCDRKKCERLMERLECSHGGVTVNADCDEKDIPVYKSYDVAYENTSCWHSRVFIDRDGNVR